MSRGKYANRAALRREDDAISSEIATYKRAVVRLTQERDDARAKLALLERVTTGERRRLEAERDQAVSPRVEALVSELAKVKDELARKNAHDAEFRKQREKEWRRLHRHWVEDHKLSNPQAMEVIIGILSGDNRLVVTKGEEAIAQKHGVEALMRIRHARGYEP